MKDHYLVAPSGPRWLVSSSGGFHRFHAERSEAIQAAIEEAYSSGERGNEAQVLVLGAENDLYPIWTYGRDSYSRIRNEKPPRARA